MVNSRMSTSTHATKLSKKSVLLFRAPKEGTTDLFEKELREHKYKPVSIPVLDFNYINIDKLSQCLIQYRDYSAIVFTSQRAVEATQLSISDSSKEVNYSDLTCYVVGGSTCKAAKDAGFNAVYGDAGNAEKLAEYIITGFCLNEIEVYETVRNKSIKLKVEELIQHQGLPEYVVYFSPSGVQYTEDIVSSGLLPLNQLKVIAIGPTTEKELIDKDIPVYSVASTPDPQGLILALP